MGVAGLWEVLRPAGEVRSLTELALTDGFIANPSGQRGFRIGIDASIWFFHAAYGKEGENPELRTLFFRCCRLLQTPLLPLFVFDGPKRPAIKRGKRVGGNTHWLTQGMKNIIEAFGFEWRMAPGEAEAELAYLNRIGVIDAVLSDDVDNFLFGATMVIRNPSSTLSGNRSNPVKNSEGKDDGNHVLTYRSSSLLTHPSISLSRPGTILIALLSGGDYIPAGLPGCGQKFAVGLARAGFGDKLVKGVQELQGNARKMDEFLEGWREDMKEELRTNKGGFLPSKKPSLAASLPDDFPSLPVLLSYVDPITSENEPLASKSSKKTKNVPLEPIVWKNDPDPSRIAALCELYFEWGVKDVIIKRFRTVLWPGLVCRAVRRGVLASDGRNTRGTLEDEHSDEDIPRSTHSPSKLLSTLTLSSPSKSGPSSSSTTHAHFSLLSLCPLTQADDDTDSPDAPSPADDPPLLQKILSTRTHASTAHTPEYRLLIDPSPLVARAEEGVKGLRPPLVGGMFGASEGSEDGSGSGAEDDEGEDSDGIRRLETAGPTQKPRRKKKSAKSNKETPLTPLRIWLPAVMLRAVAPRLVGAYEEGVAGKAKRSKGKSAGAGAGAAKSKASRVEGKESSTSVAGPSTSKPKATRGRAGVAGGGTRGGRPGRKPKQASEAQDEGYEYIDLSAGESPCSESDEEGPAGATKKGKGKAGAKTGGTMKDFLGTTKPKTSTSTKPSKPSKPSASKPSTSKTAAYKRAPLYEEEDDDEDEPPPPLPKTSRPLDLLRSKQSAARIAAPAKATSPLPPQREEEEESSPSRSSAPQARAQTQRKKPPSFVDVSDDDDSDIEVSDVKVGLGSGSGSRSQSTSIARAPVKGAAPPGIIDLSARSKKTIPSTSTLSSSVAPTQPSSSSSSSRSATTAPKPAPPIRSTSKLAHILLQEEEEASSGDGEGDELPTFHRGSRSAAKSKSKSSSLLKSGPGSRDSSREDSTSKAKPAPRPFPMSFPPPSPSTSTPSRSPAKAFPSPPSPSPWRNEGDEMDVFTSPQRAPSPPRSPSPTPSPAKPLPGASSSAARANGAAFPMSPTTSRRRTPPRSDSDLSAGPETAPNAKPKTGPDSLPKSPRKSTSHTSPRHIRPPSSPTLQTNILTEWLSQSPRTSVRRATSPTPASAGKRGPRPSDESAIYISSDSEDVEDTARDGDAPVSTVDIGVDGDGDEEDGQGDIAMILSSPPSLPAPRGPLAAHVRAAAAPVQRKFRPAVTALTQAKANMGISVDIGFTPAASTGRTGPTSSSGSRSGSGSKAPLLVARAKATRSNGSGSASTVNDISPPTPTRTSKPGGMPRARPKPKMISREEDIIDLTSD
ncbi:hypothetical protein HYDPIDRAFT_189683 [Hydnomerulius pinastri MD-312]|uniref:XPG-I domain-containing protein n=1 Tax=Hydnomerulius pinastri MD-312 TaxID=994086 RepID=A0A0C9VTH2_9AGAM|nr:hypothetical protein HYDPIDRAFT_189683 [Hydnomerulius pinastri MD-312]